MKRVSNFWIFAGAFVLVGAMLPVILFMASRYFNNPDHQSLLSYRQVVLEKTTLILWPTSIISLAEAPGYENTIAIYSLVGNVLLYAFVGGFVWLGINKNKAFFIIPVLALTAIWWWLLSLK